MNEVQKVILEIFKVISAICEKHNLRYWAIAGTCLGAVRHKGFIPWDGDMDIGMPAEDYMKFIEFCKTELPDHMEIISQENVPSITTMFIKIIDKRTTMTSKDNIDRNVFLGVWVDVMPFIGVPANNKKWKRFSKKIILFRRINWHTGHGFPKEAQLKAKLFWLLVAPLHLVPRIFFWNYLQKFLKKHTFDSAECTTYIGGSGLYDKLFCPKKWFENSISLPFEDTTMKCPTGYHEYLTQEFGDYMTPPPEEERKKHVDKDGIVDLEHSYKDYQSGKLSVLNEKNKTQ